MSDISLEQVQEAKDELARAVQKYVETVDPGSYVNSWCVLTERLSVEMVQNNTRAVSLTGPTEQSFVVTRGLLEVVMESERHRSNVQNS